MLEIFQSLTGSSGLGESGHGGLGSWWGSIDRGQAFYSSGTPVWLEKKKNFKIGPIRIIPGRKMGLISGKCRRELLSSQQPDRDAGGARKP